MSAKPHIGTFRLVKMVGHIRATIDRSVASFAFSTAWLTWCSKRTTTRVVRARQSAFAVWCSTTAKRWPLIRSSLAIGHSARDTFKMLHERGVYIEPKPFRLAFALSIRVGLIDRARVWAECGQRHSRRGRLQAGASRVKTVARSTVSACVPAGTVVAATSEEGRVVTQRHEPVFAHERNANAGIVVGIEPADFPADMQNPLGGIDFQRHWGAARLRAGRGNYNAPGQLVERFRRWPRFDGAWQR